MEALLRLGVSALRSRALPPRIELLVVQATPFCNLDCDYCYLPHRTDRRRMSEAVLTATFERVFSSGWLGDEITVVWHAGEPTVLPAAYYERAIAVIEKLRPRALRIVHSFQTNATRIDDRWLGLLHRPDVRVGVSLDGPRDLHDRHRRSRGGRGSFDATIAGLHRLQAAGIAFHVISVLTVDSLADADTLYDFFVATGVRHVGFNIDETEGANARSSMHAAGAEDAFRHFFRRFLARVEANPDRLVVREFAGALAEIADVSGEARGNPQAEPFRIVNVDVEGNVTTFSPELVGLRDQRHGDFVVGNVLTDSFTEMARSDALRRQAAEIADGVASCREVCPYFPFCRGGAPANKLCETGRFDATETLFCRLTKRAVFDTVLEGLEERLGMAGYRDASLSLPPLTAEGALGASEAT